MLWLFVLLMASCAEQTGVIGTLDPPNVQAALAQLEDATNNLEAWKQRSQTLNSEQLRLEYAERSARARALAASAGAEKQAAQAELDQLVASKSLVDAQVVIHQTALDTAKANYEQRYAELSVALDAQLSANTKAVADGQVQRAALQQRIDELKVKRDQLKRAVDHAYQMYLSNRTVFHLPDGRTLWGIGQEFNRPANPNTGSSYEHDVLPALSKVVALSQRRPGWWSSYYGLTCTASTAAFDTMLQEFRAAKANDPHAALMVGIIVHEQLGKLIDTHECDAELKALGATMRNTGLPFFVRPLYEINFEGDSTIFAEAYVRSKGLYAEGSAAFYEATVTANVAGYQRAVQLINEGAGGRFQIPNVAYVWHVVGWQGERYPKWDIEKWWPGDDYVDWVGLSWFFSSMTRFARPLALAEAKNLPFMVPEAGPIDVEGQKGGTRSPSVINTYLKPVFDTILNTPRIKAFMYINWNWPTTFMPFWPTTRLQDDTDAEHTAYGYQTSQEYFASRIQHPKFDHKP